MERPLKIFMCCHSQCYLVPPAVVPVQGGRTLHPSLDGMCGDDIGDSISEKNPFYCELTVQYYAWKNEELSSYGFCHYRRFFCFDKSIRKPYRVTGKPSERIKSRAFISEDKMLELLKDFNIATVRSEDMGVSVREHYCTSKYHYKEDLELFLRVLEEKVPHIMPYAREYLSQNRQYFCNMFIMDREHFNEYCSLLFPVLEEFDRRKTLHGDAQSDRTDGYLGERFVGIYLFYARDNGARILELPRLDICFPLKKRLLCRILPPESKVRFTIKKYMKHFS
ncbi:putative uncharacterized protein [Eubacterium sp. CAG:786]|nr:putative uncharacterized protein [Eubacterium sp. CAG:786]